jgi:hypothetical protein
MGQVVFASYSPAKKCTNGGPETSNPMGKKPATVFYSSGNKNHPPPPTRALVLCSATGRKDSLVQSRRIFSMITPTMSSTNRLLKIP